MKPADGHRANDLAVLYDLTRDLGAQPDLPTLLDTIAARALVLLAAPAGNIYLYEDRHRELQQVAGSSPIPLGARVRLGEGVAGQVAQTRRPVRVRDYRTWVHRSPQYDGVAVTAVVGVPLLYGGAFLGVLTVAELETTVRRFTTADVQLLTLFAEHAAGAVHNARLFAEARLLEESERLRADFIATISHDLRTPLTAARAGLGLLETSTLNRLRPDEVHLLATARRNIERLRLQIDDLLIFNQVEAHTLHLDPAPLDLQVVVRSALSAVDPLLYEKGQSLDVTLTEPLLTEGDQQRLEQVVVNLLVNAHWHTPAGTRIVIAGQCTETEVIVSVHDNGPGIPAEALERIFGRFYRLNSVPSGSGLGLAIVRAIVELHGGRVWADSGPGQGATFCVALRRAKPS